MCCVGADIKVQALARVHVNIVDLLDARVTGDIVQTFSSVRALSDYTARTKKYFSREVVKQDKLLKVLLRRIV